MSHNPYIILELPITATIRELNKQYKKLALRYHPDKNPGNRLACDMFIKMKEAYDLIKSGAYEPDPFEEPSYRAHRWDTSKVEPPIYKPFECPSYRGCHTSNWDPENIVDNLTKNIAKNVYSFNKNCKRN